MTWQVSVYLVLCLVHISAAAETLEVRGHTLKVKGQTLEVKGQPEQLRDVDIAAEMENNATLWGMVDEWNSGRGDVSQGFTMEFPCEKLRQSKKIPTSVHRLKPADIKVVAALGDSITAGRAAGTSSYEGLKYDYRGLSWSIGGDETFTTFQSVPNILREYNQRLHGFSTGQGGPNSKTSAFNVAISGARSNILLQEASRMISLMQHDAKVNFLKDWKLVTIFIGGNDICQSCLGQKDNSAAYYASYLRDTLALLQASLPRTVVNLVPVHPVEKTAAAGNIKKCQHYLRRTCPCAAFPATEVDAESLRLDRLETVRLTEEMVDSGQFDTRGDFTVVVQPLIKRVAPPLNSQGLLDLTMYAADCFHLSRKGHALMGMALWNNMFEPVGNKTEISSFDDVQTTPLKCPTHANPYIYTRLNSGISARHRSSGSAVLQAPPTPSPPTRSTPPISIWDSPTYLPPLMYLIIICIVALVVSVIAYRMCNGCGDQRLYQRAV